MGQIFGAGQGPAQTGGYRWIRMEPLPGGYIRIHDERDGTTRTVDVETMRERLRAMKKTAENELYASERDEIMRAIYAIEDVCRRAETMLPPTKPRSIIVPGQTPIKRTKGGIILP